MANRVVQTIYELKDKATEVLRRISGATDKNAASAEKSSAKIERANKSAANSYKKTAAAVQRVKAGIIAVAAAVTGAVIAFGRLAKAADEQERAEALLANTLTKLTGATEAEIDALKRQAQALQQTTRFGDEQTISAQAMLGTFQLTAEQIGQITPGLLDMAEASRKGADGQADLNSIAIAVGKAFTSGIGSLSRYGVALTDLQKEQFRTADQAGKVAIVVDALRDNFDGAAEAAGNTFGGQLAKASNAFGDFLEKLGSTLGQSEAFQRFISRVTGLFATLGEKTESGGAAIQSAVDRIGEALNSLLSTLQSSASFIRDYSSELAFLAKAFLTVKATQFVAAIGTASAAMLASGRAAVTASAGYTTATTRIGRMGAALRALPGAIQIGIALVGIQVAIAGAKSLGEALAGLSVDDELSASQERIRSQLLQTAAAAAEQLRQFTQIRDFQLKSAAEVAALSETEQAAYKASLVGLEAYNKLKLQYLLNIRESVGLTAEESAELGTLIASINAVAEAQTKYTDGIALAAELVGSVLTPAQKILIDQLDAIAKKSGDTGKEVSKLFEDAFSSPKPYTALADLAISLEVAAGQSKGLGESIQDALSKLDPQQLLQFAASARGAFDELADASLNAGRILDAVVLEALNRLGVRAELLGVEFTQSGQAILDTLTAIGETGRASAEQIYSAYQAAIEQLNTDSELDRARARLAGLFREGAITADHYERLISKVNDRLADLQNLIDPIAEDFRRLGIVSQAELERAAAAAEESFDRIVRAARDGEAAQADIRNAFIASARAQLDAAAGASEYERRIVESQIEVQAATYGVRDALIELGIEGRNAGDEISDGAAKAEGSLERLGDRAEETGGRLEDAGNRGARAAARYRDEIENTTAAFGTFTAAQQEMIDSIFNSNLPNRNRLLQTLLEDFETLNASEAGRADDQAAYAAAQRLMNGELGKSIDLRREEIGLINEEAAAIDRSADAVERQASAFDRATGKSIVVDLRFDQNPNANLGAPVRLDAGQQREIAEMVIRRIREDFGTAA